MGYHSSPSITLLLTLFNVRLGWWLGNPGEAGDESTKRMARDGRPSRCSSEAFGQTTDQSPLRLSVRRRPFRESRSLRNGAAAMPASSSSSMPAAIRISRSRISAMRCEKSISISASGSFRSRDLDRPRQVAQPANVMLRRCDYRAADKPKAAKSRVTSLSRHRHHPLQGGRSATAEHDETARTATFSISSRPITAPKAPASEATRRPIGHFRTSRRPISGSPNCNSKAIARSGWISRSHILKAATSCCKAWRTSARSGRASFHAATTLSGRSSIRS